MKQSIRAKRLLKQNQRLGQGSKLNLVALMDIFTILVFFLMVNQSDVQILQSNKNLSLPKSIAEQLPTEQVMMTITADGIVLQGKQVWQGDWQQSPEVWQDSLAAALNTELAYLASQAGPLTEKQQLTGRSLTILGDAAVPYALLRRLISVSAANGYRDLSLAVEHYSSAMDSGSGGAG
ncbi:ExbD/TolR family protein [Arsukibacterium sp.]|uniref:ExbD/TolR family protein n=1 Tax=Arsukibacterium sp. TaxID=1977258 RepID=UPI002FDB872E